MADMKTQHEQTIEEIIKDLRDHGYTEQRIGMFFRQFVDKVEIEARKKKLREFQDAADKLHISLMIPDIMYNQKVSNDVVGHELRYSWQSDIGMVLILTIDLLTYDCTLIFTTHRASTNALWRTKKISLGNCEAEFTYAASNLAMIDGQFPLPKKP
jgi:hypothetical protein